MALKGKREVLATHVDKTAENVAERGHLLIAGTLATEVQLGGAIASGQLVAGLLLDDVAQLDLTANPENRNKNEIDVDEPVSLAIKGVFLTDAIPSGVTVAPFEDAYYADNGKISNVLDGVLDKKVGRWLSVADSNGFAQLELDLI